MDLTHRPPKILRVTKGVLQTSSLRILHLSYPQIFVVHIFNLSTFLFVGYNLIPGLQLLYLAERIFAHSLRCSLEGRMTSNMKMSPVVRECSSLHGKTAEDPIFQQTFSWPFRNFPVFPTLLF